MTKLTTVKSTAKQLTIVAAFACASLVFTKSALAEAIQVKTEPLEQRSIEQPHLDVLLNMEKALNKLATATSSFEQKVKNEKEEFEQCADNLCKGARLGESASAYQAYAKAKLEYAEEVRDIETNQMQYLIDTMQMKHDSYLSAFNQKRAEFFDSYDQVLPQIQALNIQSPEDATKLTSDEYLALSKFGVQLDRSLDDLTMMMYEVEALDKTKEGFESGKKSWHEHANEYELRAVKLEAAAFKQTRRKDYLALVGYQNISFQDLNSIASTLSALPSSSGVPFIPGIAPAPQFEQGDGVITAQRDGVGFLFDNTLDRLEKIRNFKRN